MPKWTHSHGNPETALALPCGPSTPGSRVQAQDLPGRARSRALRTSLIQFPRLFHTRAGKRKFVVRSPAGVRLLHSRQAVKEAPSVALAEGNRCSAVVTLTLATLGSFSRPRKWLEKEHAGRGLPGPPPLLRAAAQCRDGARGPRDPASCGHKQDARRRGFEARHRGWGLSEVWVGGRALHVPRSWPGSCF